MTMQELEWPAQSPDHNPTGHFCYELELVHLRPNHSVSVPDPNNARNAQRVGDSSMRSSIMIRLLTDK